MPQALELSTRLAMPSREAFERQITILKEIGASQKTIDFAQKVAEANSRQADAPKPAKGK